MLGTRRGQRWGIWRRRLLAVGSVKTPIGALTSLRRSDAARILAAAAIAGMLLLGAGCNTWGSGNRYAPLVRPSPSETSRLLSNAHYYKLMGRPEAALKELEEAHRADPDNLKIADALAQNYQELGHFQRSQEIYQEVLARQGSNRALQNNLCFSFYLQGNLSKAETCFKETLERDPGNLAARNNLGLLWCRQGKLAEAQRLWEESEGAAGAQTRMNQALAFLGKTPANYAKLPEPEPQRQAAAPPKPATVAPPAKPDLAAGPAPVKSAPPTPPAATAAKATPPVAVKPAETKQTLPGPAVIASKPAAPVTGAVASKPAEAQALVPVKPSTPTPPPVTLPKVEQKVAAKPAEPKPSPPPRLSAPPKPTTVVPSAKPDLAAAPAPVKSCPPTPPAATAAKAASPVAVKPAEAKPILSAAAEPASKPAAPVTGAVASKPAEARALVPVKPSTPTPPPVTLPRVEQKVATKPAEPKPSPPPRLSAPLKPAAPATVVSPAKPQLAAVPAPVKSAPTTPPAATPAKAAPPVAVKPAETKPALPAPAVPASKPAAPVTGAVASKPAEAPALPQVQGSTSPAKTVPMMALKQSTKPTPPSPPLTALERETTGIEVRNGTWTRNLAHQTRTLLWQEGFKVSEIGNHIDFGAAATVIYYRPGAERVAQGLIWQVFPQAKLEPTAKLKDGVAIKVLLGRDLLDQPLTMARIATAGSEAPLPAVQITQPAPQPQAVTSKAPIGPVAPTVSSKSTSMEAPTPAKLASPPATALAIAKVKSRVPAALVPARGVLTTAELLNTPIEIRNGTRTRNLAHQARILLSQEGFNVGIIGNHIDFGAEYTLIYYRPEAEKVARALTPEIFPGARLIPTEKLHHGMSIKVVLGRDLLERPRLMSRLAAE